MLKDLEVVDVTNVKIHILTFVKTDVIVDTAAIVNVNTRLDILGYLTQLIKNLNAVK
ncbi:hypothetical protein KB230_00135 [Staphylococcus epidermidis]|uniref:hypothetical protein n=1 Tax=Staphylococcus epidermidis TaxID=1282 RepID=UPI001F3E0B6C|nr:hypothetical protein [Staphylococcus epidermidis]UJA45451.1 hypothetical protein KB230_00135 [Staphylococcus epidermidis]